MRRSKLNGSLVALAALVGLLAGCGGTAKPTPPAPAPTLVAAAKTQALFESSPPCSPSNYYMQCAAQAPGQTASFSLPLRGTSHFGIDFYGGGSPSGFTVKSHAATFGASYVPLGSKGWTAAQLASFHSAGLGTVIVFESSATRALGGYSAGRSDAQYAAYHSRLLGEPTDRPIFFAVDTDTSAAAVLSYFRGVNSVIGKSRTGVYGGYRVVAGLWSYGVVGHIWQTLAWSYGQWSSHACLRQTSINNNWYGYGVDYNLAVCADYGQWPYQTNAWGCTTSSTKTSHCYGRLVTMSVRNPKKGGWCSRKRGCQERALAEAVDGERQAQSVSALSGDEHRLGLLAWALWYRIKHSSDATNRKLDRYQRLSNVQRRARNVDRQSWYGYLDHH